MEISRVRVGGISYPQLGLFALCSSPWILPLEELSQAIKAIRVFCGQSLAVGGQGGATDLQAWSDLLSSRSQDLRAVVVNRPHPSVTSERPSVHIVREQANCPHSGW